MKKVPLGILALYKGKCHLIRNAFRRAGMVIVVFATHSDIWRRGSSRWEFKTLTTRRLWV